MILIVLVLMATAACGAKGGSAPTQPSTSSAVTTVSNVPPSPNANRQAGLDYMSSSQRIADYEAAWPVTTKLADAVLSGRKFGTFRLTTLDGTPIPDNHLGWVRAATSNGVVMVTVWWRNDIVDLSKGVNGFTLYGLQIERDTKDGPYWAKISRDGYAVYVMPDYFGDDSPQRPLRYPRSVQEAQEFDREALAKLPDVMQKAGV